MANIPLLNLTFVDGETRLNADNLNAIVSKINVVINEINNGGSTPSAPTAPSISVNGTVATITAESGATIKYTLDGSTPSVSNGSTYSAPITLSGSGTIKAVAIKNNLTSSVASTQYETGQVVLAQSNLFCEVTGSSTALRTGILFDFANTNDWSISVSVNEGANIRAAINIIGFSAQHWLDKPLSTDPSSPTKISGSVHDTGWANPGQSKTLNSTNNPLSGYTSYEDNQFSIIMLFTYVDTGEGCPTLQELLSNVTITANNLEIQSV